MIWLSALLLFCWGLVGFFFGFKKALRWKLANQSLSSLPTAYGVYLVLQTLWPVIVGVMMLHLTGASFYLSAIQENVICFGMAFVWSCVAGKRLTPEKPVRKIVERWIKVFLASSAVLVVLFAFGIFFLLLIESFQFFQLIPLVDFLFGLEWAPDHLSTTSKQFGAIPLLLGTFLITFIAMLVAAPCGLLSAIYLSQYASKRFRNIIKPLLEMLAGIPTVVYGFFAATVVAPWLQRFGATFGLHIAMESALAAGLVMGVMILPFVLSLCDDILKSVPKTLGEGALALGSTQYEAISQVILPVAFPGIMASFLLGISRAIGETMLVVMAAGMTAHLTGNPFKAVTTVTVQIVALLTGDQEPNSPQTLAAFALGLLLFMVTLGINIVALRIVRYYRKGRVNF